MKIRLLICILIFTFFATSCSTLNEEQWRIAIITGANQQNDEEYIAAQHVIEKYGANHVLVKSYSDDFMEDEEAYYNLVNHTADESGVKAMIINPSVEGTYEAIKAVRKKHSNMFIIVANPAEGPELISEYADLVLSVDSLRMGRDIVEQAQKQGATTFVHYSFERHMEQPLLLERRDYIKENCEARGINFLDVTVLDPVESNGLTKARQFITSTTNELIDAYGKNTAFFATNCGLQVSLISAVYEGGAIYPQPCCPSPYHGFASALGIEIPDDEKENLDYLIKAIEKKVSEKNMQGRLSTWPVPCSMYFTTVSADYAKAWLDGDFVLKNNISEFKKIWETYSDEPYEVYTLDDYENYYLFSYEYLNF